MSEFEIRPQEIYLLERYSSAEYFKEMLDAFKNMLDAAECALEVFMSDLPYDYRNRHLSAQPDVVWGERVLPNFRSTMESLNYGYKRLLEGDLSALQYSGNVNTDFRSQRVDYWPADWMDKDNLALFDQWQIAAETRAFNISITVFGDWINKSLTDLYDRNARGVLDLPTTLPIYQLNLNTKIKTGETVLQDGIYIPVTQEASAQLMLKGHDAIEALVGLDPDCPQYDHKENTEWVLVERIADQGNPIETIQTKNLKGFAGDICPKSGNWWSPANRSQSRYFEQGQVFPKIENNSWGETIWYLKENE